MAVEKLTMTALELVPALVQAPVPVAGVLLMAVKSKENDLFQTPVRLAGKISRRSRANSSYQTLINTRGNTSAVKRDHSYLTA